MASVLLPSLPGPVSIARELVDKGGTVPGALGGPDQRSNRLGNRWRWTMEMPALTAEQAQEWSAALVMATRLGARWEILQFGVSTVSPGTPLVAGAAQAGWALDVDGMTPNYAWRRGQFFSVVVDSRRYLHMLSASGRVESDGTATLPIEPALRVTPADNGVVEIAEPYIEGLISAPAWVTDLTRLSQGFSFSIGETR